MVYRDELEENVNSYFSFFEINTSTGKQIGLYRIGNVYVVAFFIVNRKKKDYIYLFFIF